MARDTPKPMTHDQLEKIAERLAQASRTIRLTVDGMAAAQIDTLHIKYLSSLVQGMDWVELYAADSWQALNDELLSRGAFGPVDAISEKKLKVLKKRKAGGVSDVSE